MSNPNFYQPSYPEMMYQPVYPSDYRNSGTMQASQCQYAVNQNSSISNMMHPSVQFQNSNFMMPNYFSNPL